MGERDFWRLEHFSDRQLLERLQSKLRTQRATLAELVAHLGEVEERRLHLAAAHGSMFSYCVQQLGMSEDEACRRIDLARLARKYPVLFGELASGRISLSVALLLKPVLTPDNHTELIVAARGASLRTARELLAARFPSPDVPSRIRKLPERTVPRSMLTPADDIPVTRPAAADDAATAIPVAVGEDRPARVTSPAGTSDLTTTTAPAWTSSPQPPRVPESEPRSLAVLRGQSLLQAVPTAAAPPSAPPPAALPRSADPRTQQRIDPLSAERYRIVFTGDACLKQKLELARDLLRHSHPSGDFALILSRALDLLLRDLSVRRFGARRKDTPHRSACTASAPAVPAQPREAPPSTTLLVATPAPVRSIAPPSMAASIAAASTAAASPAVPPPATVPPATVPSATVPPAAPSPAVTPTSGISRAARRVVLARDGLGCCWVDAEGHRCGSTAWLELDHEHPAGKGGRSEPENLRLLCRAHNRFAAERVYGRDHVERAIRARQRSAKRRCQGGRPPPSPAPA